MKISYRLVIKLIWLLLLYSSPEKAAAALSEPRDSLANNTCTTLKLDSLNLQLECTAPNETGKASPVFTDPGDFTCPEILITPENTICGLNQGAVTVEITPAGSYTYLWSNSATTQNIANLFEGTYNVTVTDMNGCSATASATVFAWTSGFSLSGTTTPPTAGQSNGSIDLSVSPAGSYTYAWSNSASTQDLSNLAAGTYNVTVTNNVGCTETATFILEQTCDLSVTYTVTPGLPFCAGELVTFTLIPAGGTPPYSYEWTNGATTPSISFIAQGVITIDGLVMDANDCIAQVFIHLKSSIWQVFIVGYPANCGQSNGIVDVTIAGSGTHTYQWSNGSTDEDLIGLSSGTYTVTITGSDGCTTSASATVANSNTNLTISGAGSPNTACGTPNGAVNITPNPPGAYTYNWSNSSTDEDLTDVAAGTYTVTVSGGGGCTASASFIVPNNTQPPIPSTLITPSSCGQSNGAIDLSVAPGGSYIYMWSNAASTEDLSGVPAGPYSVTISASNGCTATANAVVTSINVNPGISGTVSPNTTCGSPNGGVLININPPGTYTYSWSNGSASEDLSGVTAGSYTITVSAGGGCTASAGFTVNNNLQLPIPSAVATAATCGQNNAAINLNVSPAGTYTFLWSNGESTQNLTDLAPGTYLVTVTGSNNCSATLGTTVVNINANPMVSGTASPVTACGSSNGSININVNPVSGSYTFNWSNGSSNEDLSGLAAGLYTVTVSAGGICSASASFTVSDNTASFLPNTAATAATCGQSNGAINLSINPAGAYTYNWSNGATTEDLSNVAAGSYDVTVTDANACSATASSIVPNTNLSINVTGTTVPLTSCILPNGEIDIVASPAGAYNFLWSNGIATEDLQNIPAGTYSVTVSAGGSCTSTAVFMVLNNSGAPGLSAGALPASCGFSNGSINLSVATAGTYTYLWSTMATSEDLLNIPVGTYSVTVTDQNGCSATTTASVADNSPVITLSASTSANTNCVASNGAIDLTSAPAGAYTYSWSNGTNTEDLQNVAAGTYTVIVSAGGTCTATASFIVSNNTAAPVLSQSIAPANCGLPNGSINLDVAPAGTFTYLWSTMATSEDLLNIPAGTYSVTVTDQNGCSATTTASVADNSPVITLTAATSANTNCLAFNGAIDLSSAPSGAYTYTWSNGTNTEDLQNVAAGTYTVIVSAGGTCTATASFIVSNNSAAPVLSPSIAPANCGLPNGAIDLSVAPAGAYTYLWSTMATSEDLLNIPAGTYSVTVTDQNGCSATTTASVGDNSPLITLSAATSANTNCLAANGAVDLSSAPAGAYTYTWSNGTNTEDLQNIAAGTYTITVSAGGACSATASFIVSNNSAAPVLSPSISPANCGLTNGAIDLSVAPAGTYTYLWSTTATSEDLLNIPAGTYSVVCTGADGCSSTAIVDVPNSTTNFNFSATSTANNSCAVSNGAVDLNVLPAGVYMFQWSNGSITEDLQALAAGSYTVTVTDLSGCSSTNSVTVAAPVLPQTSINGPAGACAGVSVTLNASAGFADYQWSNGQTTASITPSQSGSYAVTVTDINGCTAVSVHDFTSLPAPAPVISGPNFTCSPNAQLTVSGGNFTQINWSTGGTTATISVSQTGTYNVLVTDINGCSATAAQNLTVGTALMPAISSTPGCAGVATLDAGTGYATYVWSTGATSQMSTVTANGNYSVTVSDIAGCTGTASMQVSIPLPPAVQIQGTANLCAGEQTTLAATAGFSQYNWNTGGSLPQITVNQGGVYSVTVSDANGCTATGLWAVTSNPSDYLLIEKSSCSSQDTGKVVQMLSNRFGCDSVVETHTVLLPSVIHELQLQACAGDAALFNGVAIPAGTSRQFVFNAANSCDSIVSVSVVPFPVLDFTLSATTTCWNAENGSCEVLILGGTAPYRYSLNGGAFQTQTMFTDLPGGMHQVTAEDSNGCLLEKPVEIPETASTQVSVQNDTLSCEKNRVVLKPVVVSGNSQNLVWTWPDGSGQPSFEVAQPGTYTLRIDDGCEQIERSMEVVWAGEALQTNFFYIPNCFSPNDDGENDLFQVFPGQDFEMISFEFRVFDRWGDAMFVTEDVADGWNGFYRGIEMKPAVYVWYVRAKVLVCDGRILEIFRKGDVTIVR